MVHIRWPRLLPGASALLLTVAVLVTVSVAPSTADPRTDPADLGINVANMMRTAVPAALTTYIKAKGGHAAIDVVDRTSGATVAVNQNRTFQTASIAKFDILATRLLQSQRAGETLSANQRSLAFRMITQSDNNAATALYSLDHAASGLATANRAFGLTDTQPGLAWGRTHTTAADQVRLLSAVFNPKGPLSSANQKYMLSLMSRVEADQAWGITAAASGAATGVYVKNGWVEMDQFGHMEGDNSIGRIIEPGHDWLVATMSNYNRDDPTGEAILEDLARLAVSGLRLGTQPAPAN